MAMTWCGTSEGVLGREYMAETRQVRIPSPKMSTRPYFSYPRSPTNSMSSSSSSFSSQESLNISGSSSETPRLKSQAGDRLVRIREAQRNSRTMEVDEEVRLNPSIQSMKQCTEPISIPQQYSPMIIDEDVSESVCSMSLRLQRYRRARSGFVPINNKNNNNYEYPPYRPWEREVPLSNKRKNSNETCGRNEEKLSSTEYRVPPWMMPVLTRKPLRRPHFAQEYKCY